MRFCLLHSEIVHFCSILFFFLLNLFSAQITVKLDLRGNDIQELPTGAFKHTPYLTHLSLQRCNILKVKEGAFRGLGRLVFLNLANNNIEILYQVITQITHTITQYLQDGA